MSGLNRARQAHARSSREHYVAGVGRGAVGFTTRSDIGPARAPDAGEGTIPPPAGRGGGPPPGYIAGGGRGMGGVMLSGPNGNTGEYTSAAGRGSGTAGVGGFGRERDEGDYGDYSETNYDEFAGYGGGGGLFQDAPYDREDQEADSVYSCIDERMDLKRKRRREEKYREDMNRARKERPKISDQFADLKSQLNTVSDAEWASIPDIGDYSLKYKANQQKAQLFTPMPDHVIEGARTAGATTNALSGSSTPYGIDTPSVTGFAETRGTVLSLKLDKMSDSISGQTVVDPKGYLTDLNSLKITSDAEVGDIKKARMLLRSVTTTNPKHGPGWIAAARLEEVAGKLVQARKIMTMGCESCPENEDVWLEAARLRNPQDAKTVLANAVRHVKTSVKVWMYAAQLEDDDGTKKLVLRRALEFIPNSVKLWKAAIGLENEQGARIMLGRAVECVPQSVDLWLALARLESYENAKKTLNKARVAIPTEPAIWITASKLEEAFGNTEAMDRIIQAAIASLTSKQVVIDREMWLKEAEACENANSSLTCAAIVRCCLNIGVEEEDRKRTWMDDAENCIARGATQTARAIYAHSLQVFPSKKSVWLRAVALERKIGSPESVIQLLQKAVECCPQTEVLWLMAAKEEWKNGNVDDARMILRKAFSGNPNSEHIWLAAVKLEWENNEFERARTLLARARTQAPSARVFMKSILLERELHATKLEEELLLEGINAYPDLDKLYMMAGQFYENEGIDDSARRYFRQGVQRCPQSTTLWILSARLEERMNGITKARSILEVARLRNPKSPELWLEATRLEGREGNVKGRELLMAKALQDCPDSGKLLAETISIAPRTQQRAASLSALRKCDKDPYVCLAVARLFWNERKYPKARKWFERTIQLDSDFGDGWIYYYEFEVARGSTEEAQRVFTRCVAAEPKQGERWCSVAKQTCNRRLPVDQLLLLAVASSNSKKE